MEDKKIVNEVIKIGLNEKKEIIVYGQLENKRLCLFALTDAIRIVYDYNPSKIVEPKIHIMRPDG